MLDKAFGKGSDLLTAYAALNISADIYNAGEIF